MRAFYIGKSVTDLSLNKATRIRRENQHSPNRIAVIKLEKLTVCLDLLKLIVDAAHASL